MLKVSDLHKKFDDHIIYNGFNLDINKGEIFALIGPNGIGKTSLIRMILGLDKDYSGNIDYNGFKIGYSPETPTFPEILTGMELLELIKNAQGTSDDLEDLMRKVGLDPANKTKLGKYSKGMIQSLAVAEIIIVNPDIILLDEPSSGLDFFGQMAMQDLIKSLKSSDKAIVLNSHLLWDVERICDRGVIIMGPDSFKYFTRNDFREKSLADIFIDFGREVNYDPR